MDDGLITPYIHSMDECALQIPTTMMSGLVKKSLLVWQACKLASLARSGSADAGSTVVGPG